MNLYSKLEKHLPREKIPSNYRKDVTEYNTCKAQYDEVLRRVVVDEGEVKRLIDETITNAPKCDIGLAYLCAKAIANSPDVIKVDN